MFDNRQSHIRNATGNSEHDYRVVDDGHVTARYPLEPGNCELEENQPPRVRVEPRTSTGELDCIVPQHTVADRYMPAIGEIVYFMRLKDDLAILLGTNATDHTGYDIERRLGHPHSVAYMSMDRRGGMRHVTGTNTGVDLDDSGLTCNERSEQGGGGYTILGDSNTVAIDGEDTTFDGQYNITGSGNSVSIDKNEGGGTHVIAGNNNSLSVTADDTGSLHIVAGNGNVVTVAQRNNGGIHVTTDDDSTVSVDGDVDIDASGNVTIDASGAVTIQGIDFDTHEHEFVDADGNSSKTDGPIDGS